MQDARPRQLAHHSDIDRRRVGVIQPVDGDVDSDLRDGIDDPAHSLRHRAEHLLQRAGRELLVVALFPPAQSERTRHGFIDAEEDGWQHSTRRQRIAAIDTQPGGDRIAEIAKPRHVPANSPRRDAEL